MTAHKLFQGLIPRTNRSNTFPMARLLQPAPVALTLPQAVFAAMTLLLCSFAMFMCAEHSRKRRNWNPCYGLYDDDPVIHQNNENMMVTAVVHGVETSIRDESLLRGEQQGVSVWQKNILMGGKCQLPDFSGVIIYDSEGNIVTPAKPRPLLTWK